MTTATDTRNAAETLIFDAVVNHDVATFREALRNGFHPSHIFFFRVPNFHSYNLLEHAVKSDFRDGIEILLRETNICTRLGFIQACIKRNDDFIRLFLQVACEKRRSFAEYLLNLLDHQFGDIAQEFIQRDEFNVEDKTLGRRFLYGLGQGSQSAMHVSAFFKKPQLLEYLIKRGAVLDTTAQYTPLYVACMQRSYDCCLCLLRHGANPSVVGSYEVYEAADIRSPLLALCSLSATPANEDIVDLLLSAGLDMSKEKWLLTRWYRYSIGEDTVRLLTSLCKAPCSLELTCVRSIRLHLSMLTSGRSILARVQELPVSPILKARLIGSGFGPALWSSSPTL